MSSQESLETPNRVVDTQIERPSDQNRQLRAELRVVQRQLARALEMLEHQQTQLAAHDTSIARLDRILMELLTGRLWRTLRAAGQMVARFLPTPAGSEEAAVVRGRHNSFLVCDEPKATDLRPRSGLVIVRGWCL
ncbi:MAG: hypothetical protein JO270_22530, partial [Acidobacteriaceae bacterium]|nr:hypothetical protein [Acidobacteriaceae bacterium]